MQDSLVIRTPHVHSFRRLTTGKLFAWVLQNPSRATCRAPSDTAALAESSNRLQVCEPRPHDLPLTQNAGLERQDIETDKPLRPLTSLKWPYVPDESAYPDPLKRDDPKIVQLSQYEAIGNFPFLVHITFDTSYVVH
ncbi:hypothetical protein BDM02DRAFT_3116494 [Thelephora ganbajun]|uniref:Uncharacterized protein n=1 Tax=Thelephora ganbajun TaxID=370292 RepID=A0ACB6ZDU3_THEGA|nr:hypothetical protein BDM02DRAFT_3116494 [Thelephora ganbajun]